ncbi:carbamoyltransferase HypF [Tautonia sociabilis]|uniref:Carbamoyltransferase n=1 Tax=Tautonia sociabilis TaxID=2080755 RepID=A0A432MMX4_9BACT|nr:carbamoyltransferase HypF [Tautonia sociabilis]RUL88772.1 carbamoyltransferase HypF [Tautonia sociabilis]
MPDRREALRIEVRGVVQGVGFRPAVDRLARSFGLAGWVSNDSRGVSIHVEGDAGRLEAFASALRDHPPPSARIVEIERRPVPAEGFETFEIRASTHDHPPVVLISPDLPPCPDCLEELEDPRDRRHRYPYLNCSACGPRYSIITALPYDRPNTTMADWPMCEHCRAEYEDPSDRRYHAQPTACPRCGPGYRLIRDGVDRASGPEAVARAAALLQEGEVVAIKGVGGYHLACSARDEAAVRRLRERKYRKEKPFALMARDLASAERLALLDDPHRSLLLDPARPIVLAPARASLPGVAEGTDRIGVMLPYAPLHTLLFRAGAPDPLVMTSANRSSEPISYRDDDALRRLDGIADAFLVGDRPIARRVEDSVVEVLGGRGTMIRRSRGFAPGVVCRLRAPRPILALGADLKNCITLVVSGQAIVGPHLGDLGDREADLAFEQSIRDWLAMYEIDPAALVVAHDAHPGYSSTRFATEIPCHRRLAVQHHRAHVASVLAETGELDRPVVGVALDGTGFGDDGAIWGFEFFEGSVAGGLRRAAHLRAASLPGGDAAARFPVQAAAGFLAGLSVPDLHEPPFSFPERYTQAQLLVARQVRCFPTTSAGRLFDTVAALCGFTRPISYEGQAAIWLEQQALGARSCAPYPFPGLDYRPLLESVIRDRRSGRDVGEIALAFHAAIARAVADTAAELAQRLGTPLVAISGGVFQNRLLRLLLDSYAVQERGLILRFNHAVPTNDGGISLGQAAIASGLAVG